MEDVDDGFEELYIAIHADVASEDGNGGGAGVCDGQDGVSKFEKERGRVPPWATYLEHDTCEPFECSE